MKASIMYGIVVDTSSKTRVRCVFCGVFIPKANKCIEQHTNGVRHKENIDLMSENGILFKDDVLYCKPCKCTLKEEESVTSHIESDDHANWMTTIDDLVEDEFINIDDYLSTDKEEILCEACDCSLECALASVEEHVNTFNHRCNVCEKLKPLNGIFSSEIDDQVWCKLCNIHIENTVQAILNHIDNYEKHGEWFAEIEDLLEDQDISLESYLKDKDETNAYCKKCKIEISCSVDSILNHIFNEVHINQEG